MALFVNCPLHCYMVGAPSLPSLLRRRRTRSHEVLASTHHHRHPSPSPCRQAGHLRQPCLQLKLCDFTQHLACYKRSCIMIPSLSVLLHRFLFSQSTPLVSGARSYYPPLYPQNSHLNILSQFSHLPSFLCHSFVL